MKRVRKNKFRMWCCHPNCAYAPHRVQAEVLYVGGVAQEMNVNIFWVRCHEPLQTRATFCMEWEPRRAAEALFATNKLAQL